MRPHPLNCLLALLLLSFSSILLAKDAHLKPGASRSHVQPQAAPPKAGAPAQEPTKPTTDPALREQADTLYRAGQYEQAAKLYRQAAEQGDTAAQTALGTMCLNGQGVAKDVEQGVAWYVKAARLGNAAAQNDLGMLYE
ncbi:MAG: tetratricopeptide repeat protein, partial [Candidatus Methylumidiphilus sp.]